MTLVERFAATRQLHEHPRLIAFAATVPGRVLVWLVATLLLAPSNSLYTISPLLALVLIAPQWRTQILSFGSIWVLGGLLTRQGVMAPTAQAALFVLVPAALYLCYLTARAYPRLPRWLQRNGQIALHVLVCAALFSTWLVPEWVFADGSDVGSVVRALRFLLPYLVWRCGYILLSGRRGSAARSSFLDHVFYGLPVFGGTSIPYGKGYDHLARHRAEEPQALARSHLAGIKLLLLFWMWTVARRGLALMVYGDDIGGLGPMVAGYGFDLPRLKELIASPGSVVLPVAWASVFLELVDVTLALASAGHKVIGCLRLFGYNVFRNTYKPLLAQSIVDFWNRFYYYFKELLVEFFFFPTYVSTFKAYPRLRIFAATMAAAFLGNIYYHALRDAERLVNAGPAEAWALVAPRSFYAFLLGVGICISMIREQARRGASAPAHPSPFRTLRRIAGVWLFYGVIHIWNVQPGGLTFGQRTVFFLSLFGF